MDWTWDPRKAAANIAKHGVSFDAALLVFDDPFQFSQPDPHPDGERWRTIGVVNITTLFVVHTGMDEDGVERIISARKATPRERRLYENNIRIQS
jgi:uncharacterized protein